MRLSRSLEQQHEYDELHREGEFGFFNTFKDIFMAGLMIGRETGKVIAFKRGKNAESFNESVFSIDDELLINSIIYDEFGEVEPGKEELQRIENYAAGGVSHLYETLIKNSGSNAIDRYIELLYEFKNEESLQNYRDRLVTEKLFKDHL
ncbi:hypothetical protein F8N00_02600 [Exiguobacterium sp. A1_3_1]|uniref:Dnd system-associated protein 4 n=1 Tax=Exiguobacterium indicum TaxID=296995 RepID=A0ABU8EJK0_9BACL|nr:MULTISPECIES: hypothetical protein [Exiguobacterium]MCQ4091407.1 hypothetical protein [Exiguobacterium sp. LL15]